MGHLFHIKNKKFKIEVKHKINALNFNKEEQ